jgi:DNA-binding GntR family transcriptional regulator
VPEAPDWVHDLAASRRTLERSSTAERVAGILRARVIEGAVLPGQQLAEDRIRQALGVSRNTLREAFRLLGHERLLVHEFGRGVFVAEPTARDVTDLYKARRALELTALRGAAGADATALARVGTAVDEGMRSRDEADFWGIGTANMHFHQAIAALAGSPRIDEIMGRLLAEMRLVFHVMDAPQEFHAPYLDENKKIYELLRERHFDAAADRLAQYLDAAEHQLLEEFSRSSRM